MKTLNQSPKFFDTLFGTLVALILFVPGAGFAVWGAALGLMKFGVLDWTRNGCRDFALLMAIIGLCVFLVFFKKDDDESNDLKFN